ncbi:hypothetical protein [Nocardioides iriomotensis]|uniref:Uncharacterized protein n=1 Tax=Nocardioides iriomotensis TaxID=715784 RepID=A0A4Q5J6V2_9ACTN|nr:hypothetical protein [Nocardioides iriomotensis]RYU13431.1 hypothetical protein ETU37_06260 [Nocardioides iriomotensis]
MHELILWCSFLGAWLLVAGPVYQAVLELQEEELEFDRVRGLASAVPAPPPLSRWWWLVPPARLLLSRRRQDVHRRAVVDALSDADHEVLVSYIGKARGWLIVGAGAFLIACKETWELVEGHHWPEAWWWVLVPLMALLSVAWTVGNAVRQDRSAA